MFSSIPTQGTAIVTAFHRRLGLYQDVREERPIFQMDSIIHWMTTAAFHLRNVSNLSVRVPNERIVEKFQHIHSLSYTAPLSPTQSHIEARSQRIIHATKLNRTRGSLPFHNTHPNEPTRMPHPSLTMTGASSVPPPKQLYP